MEFYELNEQLKGVQLARGPIGGLNPTLDATYPAIDGDQDGGGFWSNADDILDSAGRFWCAINPKKCGAASQQAPPVIVQQTQTPGWLLPLGIGVVVLLLFLILKK